MLLLSAFLPLWFSLARAKALKPQALHRFPAVDLLLPSCGEPLEVVRRSLQGARPSTTQPSRCGCWMTAIAWNCASSLRAGLPLFGPRSSHAHAKAGNLNAALPQLQGELVAVMDADVVPQRSFLSAR